MPPIEWKPEYSIGDPAVDQEHRELVDLVATAAATIRDPRPGTDIERILGDLFCVVSARFAQEEERMREVHYDKLGAHKCEHERLLDALRDVMDAAYARPDDAAEELQRTFADFFARHFRIHDARLYRRIGRMRADRARMPGPSASRAAAPGNRAPP